MSSSRWRSRHWQTTDEVGSGGAQSEVTQDTHQNYNEQKREEDNNRNNDDRYNRNDMSVDSHQQYDQQNSGQQQQKYKSSSMSQSATSSHRGEGTWQRGQYLPSSHDMPNNNRRTKQQESASANSNRSGSTGRDSSSRATFAAAPAQGAWGSTNSK